MKVLLVNGSPHANGCTAYALREVAKPLHAAGIETELFQLGAKPLMGCTGCRGCAEKRRCIYDDVVNEFIPKAIEADGFVFGSPVYFASMNGAFSSFMDRAFFAAPKREAFHLKPAAAIVNARRGGTTASFDQMNKYFTISQMPIISSCYWNQTHGYTPEEVAQDLEGMRTMRVLGKNMAWFLQCKAAAAAAGVAMPEDEPPAQTNFIR